MILVITNGVNLEPLWHKPYIGWGSSKFVKHCMSLTVFLNFSIQFGFMRFFGKTWMRLTFAN